MINKNGRRKWHDHLFSFDSTKFIEIDELKALESDINGISSGFSVSAFQRFSLIISI